jgi:hypothetical protein
MCDVASLASAGSPYQKGYHDSKSSYSDCDHCRHHPHLKHPPRASVASAVAAPQFVVAQASMVNPFSGDASGINPNMLRALASLMDNDANNSPAESANDPSQKGNASDSAASPQAAGKRDLETEVARLEDKLNQLETTIQRLNESTTRVLQALTNEN